MKLFRSFRLRHAVAAAALVWAGVPLAAAQTPTPAPPATQTTPTNTTPVLKAPLPDKSKDKPVPAAFLKANPESVEDLKAIEDHVKAVLARVIPCTVGVRMGGSSGSGVIVSEDGLVLTAAHVSGTPGRDCEIIMPDNTRYKAKSLGGNATIDSGMIKITDKGKFPFVEIGQSSAMKVGDWCIVTGQPGGFKIGRSPVVRVGRIVEINNSERGFLRTDNTLVGGDSGGPLWDLQGRVIGIHSRIGQQITANMDVPIDTYVETWDRLVKGERWGSGIGDGGRGGRGGRGGNPPAEPEFGLKLDPTAGGCKVSEVVKDSPAEKAGVKIGDIIKKFDGKDTSNAAALEDALKTKRPGDEVAFEIVRGAETLTLRIVAAAKPAPPGNRRGGGGGGGL